MLPPEIVSYARRLYEAPYEVYSRFLLERPRFLAAEEAERHLAEGGGLSCAEKARALAAALTTAGLPNEIVSGGYELWLDGRNLLAFRGHAAQPPNQDFIARFFATDWETSPYEVPAQLSHWANLVEMEDERFLIDTTGTLSSFKLFNGPDVDALLEPKRKAYLEYFVPGAQRLYYHRLRPDLLRKVQHKEDTQSSYVLGRFLGTSLFATSHSTVNLKWWWRDEALARDLEQSGLLLERLSAGRMTLASCTELEGLQEIVTGAVPAGIWEGMALAWPSIRRWVARLFDSPKHLRFWVTRSKEPLAGLTSNQLRYP